MEPTKKIEEEKTLAELGDDLMEADEEDEQIPADKSDQNKI